MACRRVVDAPPASVPLKGYRTVGGPQVPKEQRHLRLRQRKHWVRYELLMGAGAEEAQVVEPRCDRVAATAREPVGRRQSERRHPCGLVLVTNRRDSELGKGCRR